MLLRYVELRRVPGAPVLLTCGVLARLGFSMTPLGLLLLVEHTTGRYAPAALATAVYTLALAAASPLLGRLADRIGPAPVLLAAAVVHPVLLGALVLTARDPDAPAAILVAVAVAGGATYPPVLAVLRGAWTGLTEPGGDRAHLRGPALAADTSLFQAVFVLGPLLIAGLVTIGPPELPIAASGALTMLGTTAVARGRAMRAWRPHPATGDTLRPLRLPGFAALLACVAGLGVLFGATTVAIPAYGTGRGSAALAGVLAPYRPAAASSVASATAPAGPGRRCRGSSAGCSPP